MNPHIPFFHLLAAGLICVSAASATDYHVSPGENDSGSGAKEHPFQTLAKAVTVLAPGDICWLHAGVYRETLAPRRSGTEGKPIRFKAWPGDKVVLSGLDPVSGWQQEPNTRIWEAPMAWDLKAGNQIFCAGGMLFEARWPHKRTSDPMDPEGAAVLANSGTDQRSFVCNTLPEFPPGVWRGANVWMLAQAEWSSWTTDLTDYHPAEKRLFYDTAFARKNSWWVFQKHLPGGPTQRNVSMFYISGSRLLLESPGEWFRDSSAGKLLLIPPAGHEADFAQKIEAKRRRLAVNLSKCSYIELAGIEIIGATITLADADHCRLEGMKMSHICHSRGGGTINHLQREDGEGVVISGSGNILRDSEIGWSAGNGVTLSGTGNSVVNCFIHDCDYFGSYNCPVEMSGAENTLSHCTISRAGRDCVHPGGVGQRVEYNDISKAGLICHDLGLVYSAGHDGGNTEIAFNWVHDAPKPMCSGIYLDNYSRDFIVHHNIVWGVGSAAVTLNRPSDYSVVANNTLFGTLVSKWGPWKNEITMPGCRVINNVATRTITVKPEVQAIANVENFDLGAEPGGSEPEPKIPPAPGVALTGITLESAGAHPSIGALQENAPRWKAGWDPKAHPEVRLATRLTPLRNLLANSSFDFKEGNLAPWQNGPGGNAKAEHFEGFNFPPAEARNAIQNFSLHLPPGAGEVFQEISGLPAGKPLILAGYVRGFNDAVATLRFEDSDGKSYSVEFPAMGDWVYKTISIPAKAGRGACRVAITKAAGGDAYIDNLGLGIDGL